MVIVYRYINGNFKVKEKLPEGLQEWVDKAEEADKTDDFALYCNCIENIDVLAKKCCAAGLISERTWDTLACRYD